MERRYYLGEFEEMVLLVVVVQHGEAYGLSITNVIEDELKRSVSMSSVHTALYRLEEKGYVKSEMGGATGKRGGRRKRIFLITATGKAALLEAKQTRQYLWGQIPGHLFEIGGA
ncbi:PadR family transcriptional regulator [Roseivirga echinicomitans]|uniref:PadR family transcriptional regulator n=1 Tax=Roseivirga echinicomitans TaxID=296218 RepID=A0A150X318_9BACT|nr:helix-turn-helix transcriptional regulator [Roseivirga echinicomitans]KYG73120.1 PadR family transcriptional regulator [Roseivirga echinicomitans]